MPKMNLTFEVKFECQENCSNCCKLPGGFVYLSEKETADIADYLDVRENLFLQWFTRIIDDKLCLVDGGNEYCVFLEDNKCSVYPVRPQQCRAYPFWRENLKSKARWRQTSEQCPGIGKGKKYTEREIKDIII